MNDSNLIYPKEKASLAVVGSGIKFLSHLTTEARAYIEQSEKVLYLVNEPAMQQWIQKSNPNAESLDEIYFRYESRLDCYHAITDYILEILHQQIHLCVVLYGHPTVFAQPALEAVKKARESGYYAFVLPGISAEDCLFADLLIDPGSSGCLSFETSDFLVYRREFDPRSHLILWQVGIIGLLGHPRDHDNYHAATVLLDYLLARYSESHPVILYEAAQYPHFEPTVQKLALKDLPEAKYTSLSTLYVPPLPQQPCDEAMLKALGIVRPKLEEGMG